MEKKAMIERYFSAWLAQDSDCLREIFHPNALYSECYGPEYHGIEQIEQWFGDWNARGKVCKWEIIRFFTYGKTAAAEWNFECDIGEARTGFNGVSLIDFDEEGKITCLKEFASKAEHVYPYRSE